MTSPSAQNSTLQPTLLRRKEDKIGIGHLDSGITCRTKKRHSLLQKTAAIDRFGNLMTNEQYIDEEGHGTHTAGIICKTFSKSKQKKQTNIYSVRAINGGKHLLRILSGMNWLLDQPIRVACMAIGVKSWTPVFRPMLAALRSKGMLPIVSVGNGGAGKAYSPGWDPLVLSVGAADAEGFAARFSGSANPWQDKSCQAPLVLAPGVDIRSWSHSGGFHTASGTSMAAAHVAGLAARIFQAHPSATIEEVEAALCFSASPAPERSSHKVVFGNVTDQPEAYLAGITQTELEQLRALRQEIEDRFPKEAYFDPRLRRQLRYTGEGMDVEAIIAWKGLADSPPPSLSTYCEVLKYFPASNQMAIRTTQDEIMALSALPEVHQLSAVDIDYPNV